MHKIIQPNVTIFGVGDDGLGKFPPYFLNRIYILQDKGMVTIRDGARDKELYFIYFTPNLYGRRVLLEQIYGEDKNFNNDYIDREKATESFIGDMNIMQSPDYKIWVVTKTEFFPLLQKKKEEMKATGIYFYSPIGDTCVTASVDTPTRFPVMLPSIESLLGQFGS